MVGPYDVEISPQSGRRIKEDGTITNIGNRADEVLAQDGHRIIDAAATAATPTVGKVFIAINFPFGGSFTAVTDDALLEGAALLITTIWPAGHTYHGRVTSYVADAITDAIEGI